MHVSEEITDSNAFGRTVLQVRDVDASVDFQAFERECIQQYNPFYVYAKVRIEDLEQVHYLEKNGFNFVEYQLRMTKHLPRKPFDVSMFDGFVEMVEVSKNEDIEPILQMADEIFDIDRIYVDPLMSHDLARKRYRAYLKKSQQSDKENFFKFVDKTNGKLIGFHTHLQTDDKTIVHFLGGNAKEYQASGSAFATEYLLFNNYISKGIRKVVTHISGCNYRIFNFEFKTMDFKAEQGFAILRKVY